jgi:hypothetical protein
VSGDGCRGTSNAQLACTFEVCGDRVGDASECDEGNTVRGDGWYRCLRETFCGSGTMEEA